MSLLPSHIPLIAKATSVGSGAFDLRWIVCELKSIPEVLLATFSRDPPRFLSFEVCASGQIDAIYQKYHVRNVSQNSY